MRSKRLAATSVLAAILLSPASSWAQDPEPEPDGFDSVMLEEVMVTARKRVESLQEVPVSISVFGAKDLEAADLSDLTDVANLTPGFQFMTQGNQQPGRYNTQLQFRGLTTAQFSPSFATGALFIDGIYVLNGGTSLTLMDLDRVEVIKGPQSAYFGRNTFGGAVNLITRDPSLEEFSGEVRVRMTNLMDNEYNVFVEGPIVTDTLSFSLGGTLYDKKGQYIASDGGRTGNEETQNINGVVKWQATDKLAFKVRYGYSKDDDGAPAQGFVSGIRNDSCTGTSVETAEGTAYPVNYICGKVPDPNNAIVYPSDGKIISSNTILPQYVIDTGITDPATTISGVPNVTSVGLKRTTKRLSIFGEYDFSNGYTLSANYGSNTQDANWIRDLDLTDRINWFSRDPQQMDDQSYEARLVSPQDGRFRWLVGYNNYQQKFSTSGAGGDSSTSCFSTVVPPTDDFPAACLGGAVGFTLLFPNNLNNTDKADVSGVFAAVDFDITDQWTAIFEGRYTQDKITKGSGLITAGAATLTDSYDKFLPRAILRWQPTDTTNLYLSYSEGQIAGDFNTFFIAATPYEREQYLAQDPNIAESLPAEILNAWELGWKQGFWDGRAQVNLSAYWYTWENIKGRSTFQINESCRPETMGQTGCNPDIGQMVGDPKVILNPETGELQPFYNVRNALIPGDATIKGLELESWFLLAENVIWTVNMSYIDSKYDDYNFNFVEPVAGYSQMAGNQTPRQPKWSGNTSMTYDFNLWDHDSYLRGDWIYQGKAYVDESNLAYIGAYSLVNTRMGVNFDNFLVELFVTNLFNEDGWLTGARWSDFSSPTQFAYLAAKQGVAVSPQNKRQIGFRFNWRF